MESETSGEAVEYDAEGDSGGRETGELKVLRESYVSLCPERDILTHTRSALRHTVLTELL
jgi:hypothetical protein